MKRSLLFLLMTAFSVSGTQASAAQKIKDISGIVTREEGSCVDSDVFITTDDTAEVICLGADGISEDLLRSLGGQHVTLNGYEDEDGFWVKSIK